MVINHLEKLFVTNDAATVIKELEVCSSKRSVCTDECSCSSPNCTHARPLWIAGAAPCGKDAGYGNGGTGPGGELLLAGQGCLLVEFRIIPLPSPTGRRRDQLRLGFFGSSARACRGVASHGSLS